MASAGLRSITFTGVAGLLQVTIWNTGAPGDTYQPHIYGPFVTIHKTLNAKGVTTTKILDAHGRKTGPAKAEDVKRLLGALSVNAANPAIVMTQVQSIAQHLVLC